MPAPRCHWCKKSISGPKLVIKEMWCCMNCAYYLDKGETPPAARRD